MSYHVLALLVCTSKLLGQKPRFYRRTEMTTPEPNFHVEIRESKRLGIISS